MKYKFTYYLKSLKLRKKLTSIFFYMTCTSIFKVKNHSFFHFTLWICFCLDRILHSGPENWKKKIQAKKIREFKEKFESQNFIQYFPVSKIIFMYQFRKFGENFFKNFAKLIHFISRIFHIFCSTVFFETQDSDLIFHLIDILFRFHIFDTTFFNLIGQFIDRKTRIYASRVFH